MAEEFNHLPCPICRSELIYSEGTHDLGCKNNPKPLDSSKKKRERALHEESVPYGLGKNNESPCDEASSDELKKINLCDLNKNKLGNNNTKVCEITNQIEIPGSESTQSEPLELCVFGISFTESAHHGTLWSIRIIDGQTDYSALMRLMQNIETRVRKKEPLAANVPNLPKKIERSPASKLAFRYKLEIEDLFSIKYSTETIERLALFYDLTNKAIRHIKQTDILED